MKLTTVLLVLATAVSAQNIIKACGGRAQVCLEDAIARSDVCEEGDYLCGCRHPDEIKDAAIPCVLKVCGSKMKACKSEAHHPLSLFYFFLFQVVSVVRIELMLCLGKAAREAKKYCKRIGA